IIQTSEATARQHVSRARKRLTAERRAQVSAPEQQRLLTAFVAAARVGDMSALEELFAADVVSYSDGGGMVQASRIPVRGARTVAKVYRAWASRFWVGVEVTPATINGAPAVRVRKDGMTIAVITITASADGIDQLLWMLNPAKLAAAG
ncbi:MAG TPA: RNA polymerase subunit sigma-24, partial [Pseudonocardiaceae bacterium]